VTANEHPSSASDVESSLERVLAAYIESLERGAAVDRQELLNEYPDLAVELESFFRNRDAMERLAAKFPGGTTAAETVARGELESVEDGAFRYFGDYELEEELGRGGMGVVYRARQVSLNRSVALKRILAGPHASAKEIQRLQNEAESVAQLDHPHIVPLYEIGNHEGQIYYSMKLIEGNNLAQTLGHFVGSPSRAAELVATVARAVHHAHQRGILHRDLKPANILLDKEGTPHLTDFGLAKQLTAESMLTQSGAIMGTPSYMAPEQARGENVLTTAADVYSLGTILYELLTGELPFRADSWAELLRQVVEQDPVAPRAVARHVPRDLSLICLKCLEKGPDCRYRSALELAEDLERWLRNEPIMARPLGPAARAAKWVRRHPTLTALFVTAIVGAVGILWQWRAAVEANRRYLVQLDQRRWGLAEREWQNDDIFRARQLLLETDPDRRGWEWNYLWRLMYTSPFHRLPELETHVTAMTISTDGRLLVFSEWNGKIHVHDLETGQTRLTLPLRPASDRLALSSDNQRLVTINEEGWQLWDLEAGELLRRQTAQGKPLDVAWHPGGEVFYVASRERSARKETVDFLEAFAWDSGRRQFLTRVTDVSGRYHEFHVSARLIQVSADGRRVYHLRNRVGFHAETGERDGTLDLPPGDGPPFPESGLEVVGMVDDDKLALLKPDPAWGGGAGLLGSSRLFLQRIGAPDQITLAIEGASVCNFALSPDGRWLAVAVWTQNYDWDAVTANEVFPIFGPMIHLQTKRHPWISIVYLYDTANGDRVRTLRGFPSVATHLAFSPDGRQLTVAGGQTKDRMKIWSSAPRDWGDVIFWNVAEAETSRVLEGHTAEIRQVSIDASGQLLATASHDGTVRLWDVVTGQPRSDEPVFKHPRGGEWVGAHLAPDRDLLAVCGGNIIQLIQPSTGKVQRTWTEPERSQLHAVQLCRDEHLLAYLSDVGARVLDISQEEVVLEVPDPRGKAASEGKPNSLALSKDGRWLAVTYQFDMNGELRVYDLQSRNLAWQHRTEPNAAVFRTGWGLIRSVFSDDGTRVAAVGNNGEALVFDVRSGKLQHRFSGDGYFSWGVAFSPDGKRLATGSFDRTVRIWNLVTGEPTFALRGHRDAVQTLVYSPDGKRLISGGRDGAVRIWEADWETTQAAEPTFPPPR
jgi:eukaryotic-like serine/threonine-protein kinase